MSNWKLIGEALAVAAFFTLISGPVFWSESLTRRFFGLEKKKGDSPKKPPSA